MENSLNIDNTGVQSKGIPSVLLGFGFVVLAIGTVGLFTKNPGLVAEIATTFSGTRAIPIA